MLSKVLNKEFQCSQNFCARLTLQGYAIGNSDGNIYDLLLMFKMWYNLSAKMEYTKIYCICYWKIIIIVWLLMQGKG